MDALLDGRELLDSQARYGPSDYELLDFGGAFKDRVDLSNPLLQTLSAVWPGLS